MANKQWHDWDSKAFASDSALTTASIAKVPVCTTEIREIFRGWDFVKAHFTFYAGFTRIDAPWERAGDLEVWGSCARWLARHLIRKNATAPLLGNVRANADGCIASKNAEDAISRYHQCHARVFRGKHAVVPVRF